MKNVIQGTTLSGTGAVSIAPGAEITIRNPAGQLVPLWADRAGTQPHANPFLTDSEGQFRVYADSGWVHVRAQKDGSVREWRYVPLGSAAAMDIGEVYEALGAEVYSSVSEGLNNSAEGDFFLVESSGSLDLYRVVNGVAEQRAAGIDDNAILATRTYADGVAAEAESNATNAAVAAASAAYQQATEYSDSELQTHRESGDHDHRYYTKPEVDQSLSTKVDDDDPRLSDPREWTAEVVSQPEAEAGTSSVPRKWTAERVRQAIEALAGGIDLGNLDPDTNIMWNTPGGDNLGIVISDPIIFFGDYGRNGIEIYGRSHPWYPDRILVTAGNTPQAKIVDTGVAIGYESAPTFGHGTLNAQNGLYDGGERVVRQSDLGTAATRDVTTSPTDTTAGRVLTVGSLGLGEPIILTSSDDLDDIMSPGIYGHSMGNAPANTPIPEAGIVTVFKGEPSSFVVQVWRRRNGPVRHFQRAFDPNSGVWGSWVEFYHTGNPPPLIGVGHTWQDVTSSRVAGTTYTNTTGRPIMVVISLYGSGNYSFSVDGVHVAFGSVEGASADASVWAVVPVGSLYRLSSDASIHHWTELR